ncbi:MAG: PAS domain S-box protein [Candidatus Hydrogenedentes bacterium]|nr:PAS domain S-box protein [Candidatus Hydrogenedentota bacterium]
MAFCACVPGESLNNSLDTFFMPNAWTKFSNRSVSAKVQTIIQITGALAIAVVGLAQFLYNLQVFQYELRTGLESRVKLTVFHSVLALEFDDSETAQAAVDYLAEDPVVLEVQVFRSDGTVLAEFGRNPEGTQPDHFIDWPIHLRQEVYSPNGIYTPDAHSVGHVVVNADVSDRIWAHAIYSFVWTLGIMGLAFLVCLMAARPMLRRVLMPVLNLTRTMGEISAHQRFDLRAGRKSNDEFGLLVDQFNAMLDQIQNRDRALAGSEEQYRSLVNNINVGICIISTDPSTPPLRANPAAARIFGFESPQALCETPLIALCEEGSEWTALIDLAVETGSLKNREVRMRNRAGAVRWISLSVQRHLPVADSPLLNCALEDITETKLAEQEIVSYRNHLEELVGQRTRELQLTNAKLSGEIRDRIRAEEALMEQLHFEQALLDSLPTPVSVKDAQKKYLGCNDAFEVMMGLDKSEIIGKSIDLITAPTHSLAVNDADDNALAGSRVYYLESTFFGPGGERKIFQVQKSAFQHSDGSRGGIVTTFHDITALKQAEERSRLAREQAENINEELRKFTYIVSHDLRAPITNINGYSRELKADIDVLRTRLAEQGASVPAGLRKQIQPLIEHDIPESIEFIAHSIRRMEELVGAIFKLSRIGQRTMEFEKIDLGGLAAEVLRSFAHVIEAKGVELHVKRLPVVLADQVAMGQIFSNLIDNALKYLDPDRKGRIEIGAEDLPGLYGIYIRDNGKGIAGDELPAIFDMFQRAGDQAVPGEGIGLTFVRTLVRKHGGELRCESTLKEGAMFRFTISKELEIREKMKQDAEWTRGEGI